jgi:GDP-4-dehydro-6-deoxy-D-mannose reductase
MRAYVTGSHGFVGKWLMRHLTEMGDELVQPEHEIDVTDLDALATDMTRAAPEAVYHLAARSHVGASWADPLETLRVNTLGTEVVFSAALACSTPPKVLMVSSAEVYGAGDGGLLTEESEIAPLSPYAASKAAAEMLARQAYLGRGLQVITARPFNHVGPGQSDAFVVSAIAKRIASAELASKDEITIGDLSARRDFTDVRDVVRAYRLLIEKAPGGGLYNVSSGTSVSIEEVVSRLVGLSTRKITPVQDPALLRPAEIPDLKGDCTRLHQLTGWKPEIELATTLREMLEWWRLARTEG